MSSSSAKSGISDIWKHLLECYSGCDSQLRPQTPSHGHCIGLVSGCQGLDWEKDIKEFKK